MRANKEEYPVAAVYRNIQQNNGMCVHHLLSIGYNGNLLSAKLKEKICKSITNSPSFTGAYSRYCNRQHAWGEVSYHGWGTHDPL